MNVASFCVCLPGRCMDHVQTTCSYLQSLDTCWKKAVWRLCGEAMLSISWRSFQRWHSSSWSMNRLVLAFVALFYTHCFRMIAVPIDFSWITDDVTKHCSFAVPWLWLCKLCRQLCVSARTSCKVRYMLCSISVDYFRLTLFCIVCRSSVQWNWAQAAIVISALLNASLLGHWLVLLHSQPSIHLRCAQWPGHWDICVNTLTARHICRLFVD